MKAYDDIHLDSYRAAIFFSRFESPGAYRFQSFLIQPHSQRSHNQQITWMPISAYRRQ